MTDIKAGIAKLLQDDFQIERGTTERLFENGILNMQNCRNVLIKNEYKKKVQPKEKQRVKGKIALKYCISVDLVRKIVE